MYACLFSIVLRKASEILYLQTGYTVDFNPPSYSRESSPFHYLLLLCAFDSMQAGFSKNKVSITKKLVFIIYKIFHGYQIFQLYVEVTVIYIVGSSYKATAISCHFTIIINTLRACA